MKLIHLSDLHIGKRVNEYSMIEDQEYILKEILGIISPPSLSYILLLVEKIVNTKSRIF